MGEVARLTPPTPGFPLEGRELERAVDRVIQHQVNEIARQVGDDDEWVKFMRSTRRTAVVLPFPQSLERSDHG